MKAILLLPLVAWISISCEDNKSEETTFNNTIYSASKVKADNLLFLETFEASSPFSQGLDVQVAKDYSFMTVTTPVYKGRKAGRFELRYDDPLVSDGKRAEAAIVRASTPKDRWYSFAVYFPKDGYEFDDMPEAICQWPQSPDEGETSSTAPLALRTRENRFILTLGYNTKPIQDGFDKGAYQEIDLGEIPKDVWQHYTFHIIHSYDNDGLIEIWRDGLKIFTHTGGNSYNNAKLPRCKIGLYKSFWNKGKPTLVKKRVIYFDEIKVGNEHATLIDML